MGFGNMHANGRGHERGRKVPRRTGRAGVSRPSDRCAGMRFDCSTTLASRMRGLFGRRGYDKTLVLVPCNDVHTFGMRRKVDVAFVSSTGKVLEVRRALAPWGRARCAPAYATLERFATDEPWFESGDRVELARIIGECCKERIKR